MWMMPLHLHVNQKSDYDVMILRTIEGNYNQMSLLNSYILSPKMLSTPLENQINLQLSLFFNQIIGGSQPSF